MTDNDSFLKLVKEMAMVGVTVLAVGGAAVTILDELGYTAIGAKLDNGDGVTFYPDGTIKHSKHGSSTLTEFDFQERVATVTERQTTLGGPIGISEDIVFDGSFDGLDPARLQSLARKFGAALDAVRVTHGKSHPWLLDVDSTLDAFLDNTPTL